MVEINWTIVTYLVVGFFALTGFYRGWWKEAVTTILLVILVVLLQNPEVAEWTINLFNDILAALWEIFPDSLQNSIESLLEGIFGVEISAAGPLINAADPENWLLILLVSFGIAFLISRFLLPGGPGAYTVTPIGALLGAIVGGINGFIILNLIQEYLLGNLPGVDLPTEIARAGRAGGISRASSGLTITATDVPGFTLFDGVLPWVLIILGVILLLAIFRSRIGLHRRNGFFRFDPRIPYGYRRFE